MVVAPLVKVSLRPLHSLMWPSFFVLRTTYRVHARVSLPSDHTIIYAREMVLASRRLQPTSEVENRHAINLIPTFLRNFVGNMADEEHEQEREHEPVTAALTVKQLQQACKDRGLHYKGRKIKSDLIHFLNGV